MICLVAGWIHPSPSSSLNPNEKKEILSFSFRFLFSPIISLFSTESFVRFVPGLSVERLEADELKSFKDFHLTPSVQDFPL